MGDVDRVQRIQPTTPVEFHLHRVNASGDRASQHHQPDQEPTLPEDKIELHEEEEIVPVFAEPTVEPDSHIDLAC